MSLTDYHCFSGSYVLERYPVSGAREALRAWDAVDEYLLQTVAPFLESKPGVRVLVVNDSFGALGVALHAFGADSWGDSFSARLGLEENLRRNEIDDVVRFVPATLAPPGREGGYDVVLWRVPKAQALFEEQLAGLRPLLHAETLVLAGGMVKHLPDRAKEVLGQAGGVAVLPVRKKAVLLRVMPQAELPAQRVALETLLVVPEYGLELVGGPNVFAREKFDVGARFFLEQFGQLPKAERIADLGCGNGILGIVAKRLQPGATVCFFDESYQAVAAAEENYRRNGLGGDQSLAEFHVDDGLTHYAGEAFDLVLCNPPFHQGHVVSDQIALQMFAQSKQHLRSGGELWVVGNRHLEYHVKLRRMFGNCRQIAAHPKFVVLAAVKR